MKELLVSLDVVETPPVGPAEMTDKRISISVPFADEIARDVPVTELLSLVPDALYMLAYPETGPGVLDKVTLAVLFPEAFE